MATYQAYSNQPAVREVTGIVTSGPSPLLNQERHSKLAVQVNLQPDAATARTSLTGVSKVDTITFPASSALAAGEYVVVYDEVGAAWAAYFKKVAPGSRDRYPFH